MDCLGVAAVGLSSNRATPHQIEKLVKFAQQVANNRVLHLPDCDEEGEAGFKEMLWQLAQSGSNVRIGVKSKSHTGQFAGKQPEKLTSQEWGLLG